MSVWISVSFESEFKSIKPKDDESLCVEMPFEKTKQLIAKQNKRQLHSKTTLFSPTLWFLLRRRPRLALRRGVSSTESPIRARDAWRSGSDHKSSDSSEVSKFNAFIPELWWLVSAERKELRKSIVFVITCDENWGAIQEILRRVEKTTQLLITSSLVVSQKVASEELTEFEQMWHQLEEKSLFFAHSLRRGLLGDESGGQSAVLFTQSIHFSLQFSNRFLIFVQKLRKCFQSFLSFE